MIKKYSKRFFKRIFNLVTILSLMSIFVFSVDAHRLESWANTYSANNVNSTYTFAIMNSAHIDGKNLNYYWENSTVKNNYKNALSAAAADAWDNMISLNETSKSNAHVILKYDPINHPSDYAALTSLNGCDSSQHIRKGGNDAEIKFYGETKNYNANDKKILAAHELGHLWGIDDLDGDNYDSIFSYSYSFSKATRHDKNALRIGLNNLWFDPGTGGVWKYQQTPENFYYRGDVNLDGSITVTDARKVLRFSSKLETPTSLQQILADVDGDGSITAADSRYVEQYAARLITSFPADK